MKYVCIKCNCVTNAPIFKVERMGQVIAEGPLCSDCWSKISRSIDDDLCASPTADRTRRGIKRFAKKFAPPKK